MVAACGALSSALLLLRSASDAHPNGLANGSDQVGRNYIRHNMSVVMALLKEPNRTVFQKTLAVSDYYFGAPDWEYPLGLIQMCATSHGEQIRGEAPMQSVMPFLPEWPFDKMAEHSMDFWLQSEDLPRPENRIRYDGGRVVLEVKEGSEEAAKRLRAKLEDHGDADGRLAASDRTAVCIWVKIFRSTAPRTRLAPYGSALIPRLPCSIWTAKRMSWTICMSPTPASSPRSAR